MDTVTYLGGPTALLQIGGLRLITDPTLDPEGTTYPGVSYSKIKGPALDDVGPIDLVLLSHDQHNDNLDKAGRALLGRATTTLTTKTGAARLKGHALGLAPWEAKEFRAPGGALVRVTATPARHGPKGIEPLSGEVIGFVVTVVGTEKFELYLTGDTVFFEGIEEVAKRFQPHNVFIFAGAARARGPFSLTMDTGDALDTAATFPESTIIPLHFDGWTHYTEGEAALHQSFAALGLSSRLKLLAPGIPTRLPVKH